MTKREKESKESEQQKGQSEGLNQDKLRLIGEWAFRIACAAGLIYLAWNVIYTQHMWLNS